MSFQDGMAALKLEMPKRVPRTELTVESYHWELVSQVIGREIHEKDPAQIKAQASSEFVKAWNYDFFWWTCIFTDALGDIRTDMGHAEYASDGSDLKIGNVCPFKTPDDVFKFDPWQDYGAIDIPKTIAKFEASYAAG